MSEGFQADAVIMVVLGLSSFFGYKRGLLVTLLLLVRRVLSIVIGFVIWRVLMAMMPSDTPYALSGVVFVGAMIGVGLLFRLIRSLLEQVERIPVLKQVNKILGMAAGLALGLVSVWIVFAVLFLFEEASFAAMVIRYIEGGTLSHFLYGIDPLMPLVDVIRGFAEKIPDVAWPEGMDVDI